MIEIQDCLPRPPSRVSAVKYLFCRQNVGGAVEWLKRRNCDQHGLSSKPTRVILFCPLERHFTALFPVLRSYQAVLNFSHNLIKLKNQNKKFQPDSIFASRSG